jgi:hypothetical protein
MDESNKANNDIDSPASRIYAVLFKATIILAIPAILSYFLGNYINSQYDIKPYGSFIAMGIGIAISWSILLRMLFNINKELKEKQAKLDKLKK